jgi:alpha-tubulin suppressor-like RCC1 family protein
LARRWRIPVAFASLLACVTACPTAAPPPTATRPPTATPPPTNKPPSRAADVFTQVASRGEHTCAVREGGEVLCWGKNTYGQLGDGSREDRSNAVRVAGLTRVREVAVGLDFSCALLQSGTVSCWGNDQDGQLGGGKGGRPGAMNAAPQAVFGLRDVQQLSAGDYFACARIRDGSVRCWGNAENGQLGSDSQRVFPSPRTIPEVNAVVDVACGGAHVCAATIAGKALCWGRNTEGQLGDGKSGSRLRAVEVKGLLDAVDVASGANHTCALRRGGPVACWGDNVASQLGAGARNERKRYEPVAVAGLVQVAALAGGSNFTCALARNGRLSCWGGNESGQLGLAPSSAVHPSPNVVRNLADVTAIGLGAHHACAARKSGDVVCWGSNEHGALGPRPLR